MKALPALLQIASLLLVGTPALAETCRAPDRPDRKVVSGGTRCPQAERPTPYDPDRARAGRTPGFIDLGGGTEVRIGGRAKFDYDVHR